MGNVEGECSKVEQKFELVGQDTSFLNRSGCLMVSQWSGSDRDPIHEDLKLSRRACLREDFEVKFEINTVVLHENFAGEFI